MYYYLHTNGELISKPDSVTQYDLSYFDSPFVQKVWKLDESDRATAWKFILEALSMGCNMDRAKELSSKWGLTFEDSKQFLLRVKPENQLKEGLDIFITKILGMELEDYWTRIKE